MKRQKDLADIARILEGHPELRSVICVTPAPLRDQSLTFSTTWPIPASCLAAVCSRRARQSGPLQWELRGGRS